MNTVADREITVEYLMFIHPLLSRDNAEKLLIFAQERTIYHVGCYGDGSIIYPKFQKWMKDGQTHKTSKKDS